jgi:hypothetical protein
MSRVGQGGAERRWWLSGEETCVVCLQAYAYEIERRCLHCDRGLCPHCGITVHATETLVCTTCACEDPDEDASPVPPGSAREPRRPTSRRR